jgi:hypothetical protein
VTAKTIELAEGLVMDASEAATQTLAPISAKGGGKSYLAGKFVEGLYDAGAPFVVLDPIGNWSALTLAKDGKSPGLSVVVIGGERCDVPLDEDTAETVGSLLITQGMSAVLDLSELSKARRKVYVAGFCEALYRAARKQRSPFMVVFEEAQLFAPQHCSKGEERMLGAVTDIVRLGRNHGLGSMLVTQRPQSVSKEVLNQVECLFVGQLRGPQERKAIAGWVTEQGVDAAVDLKSLPGLTPGEFFCWSPSWLRTFRKVKILPKRTFDGSSTPVLGKARERQTKRNTEGIGVWVEALRGLTRAETADPDGHVHALLAEADTGELCELRRKLAETEKENEILKHRLTAVDREYAAVIEAASRAADASAELRAALERWYDFDPSVATCRVCGCTDEDCERCIEKTGGVPCHWVEDDLCSVCAAEGRSLATLHVKPYGKWPKPNPAEAWREVAPGVVVGPGVETNGKPTKASGLEKSDRAILSVLAWQRGPIARARLALLAGYSAKGGGFNNALGRLRTSGRAQGSAELAITDAGRKAIGKVEAPPTGAALFEWWCDHPRVDTCMRATLEALKKARAPLAKEELATRAGYKANTGGFNNALSRLRTLGLVTGKGREPLVLAHDLTWPGGRL